jgi:glycosyltransferase involved in cell wall biosynthesis
VKVTIGIVNYNRLFYLKSCAKSLIESTKDFDNIEFMCVDDNSSEPGTQEYLNFLSDLGWKIFNQQEHRNEEKNHSDSYNDYDHAFAFFDALNLMFEESSGDLFIPLQGDMQFIRRGWLQEYIDLFSEKQNILSATLDAQRRVRLANSEYEKIEIKNKVTFAHESGRRVSAAGDCVFRSSIIKELGGWVPSSEFSTPEDNFRFNFENKYGTSNTVCVPWLPPAAIIWTDPRGTNARVRGNKRYGSYWPATDDTYYEWNADNDFNFLNRPASIEELAHANGGWELPLDENGNWKKLNADQIDLDDYEIIN